MASDSKLPLPIKAIAGLGSIAAGTFASCLATMITGGPQALANTDPHFVIGAAAFGGLVGVFNWVKSNTDRNKAKLLANIIEQSATDSVTALRLIADIAKGNLKVSIRVDDNLKSELVSACRRALAAEKDGISTADAERILAAIHETATREQLESLQAEFDDYREVTEMLLWTQDHRGREHDTILRNIQELVAKVADQCPALIRIEQKLDSIAQDTSSLKLDVKRIADALEQRGNESDQQAAARLRPIIEAEVSAKLQAEFAGRLQDRDKLIDLLTKSVLRATRVSGFVEDLRKSGDGRKIFEALRQVSTHTDADFIEVHRGVAEWAFLTGAIDDAERSLRKILQLLPDDLDAVNRVGHIYLLRGQLGDAEGSYRRVLQLAGANESWQGVAYGNLGIVYKTRGDLAAAEAMYKKSLAFDEKLGRLEGVASGYGNLGNVYRTRGDLDAAEAMYKKSLAIDEKLGRLEGMAIAHGNLGIVYHMRGNLNAAEAMYKKSLAINERLARLEGMARQYGHLGIVYQTRGDLAASENMHKKALAIDEGLLCLEGMAGDYGNLGIVYQTRGDLAAAEAMYKKALAIDEKLGRLEGVGSGYGNLGNVYRTRGDLDAAEDMYKKSLAIDEKLGRLEGMGSGYGNLGIVYKTRGDLAAAEDMYRKALAINEKLGQLEGMASDYGNLGIVYLTRGDLDAAESMYKKALAINEKLGRLEGMAIQYANMGLLYGKRSDIPAAREQWTIARDLYQKAQMPHMVKQMQDWLDSLPPPPS